MADLALVHVANHGVHSLNQSEYRRLAIGIQLVCWHLLILNKLKPKELSKTCPISYLLIFLFWFDFCPYPVKRSCSYLIRRANRWSGPVTYLHGGFNLVQSRQKVQPHCRTEHRETPFGYLPVPGPGDLSLFGRRRLYRRHSHDARLFPPSGISLSRAGKSAHVLSLLVDSGSQKPRTFSRVQQSNCRFGGQVPHGRSSVPQMRRFLCRSCHGNGASIATHSLWTTHDNPSTNQSHVTGMGRSVELWLTYRTKSVLSSTPSLARFLFPTLDLLLRLASESTVIRFPQRTALQLPGGHHVPFRCLYSCSPSSFANPLLPRIERWLLFRAIFHPCPQFGLFAFVDGYCSSRICHHLLRYADLDQSVPVPAVRFHSLGSSLFHGTANDGAVDACQKLIQRSTYISLPWHCLS